MENSAALIQRLLKEISQLKKTNDEFKKENSELKATVAEKEEKIAELSETIVKKDSEFNALYRETIEICKMAKEASDARLAQLAGDTESEESDLEPDDAILLHDSNVQPEEENAPEIDGTIEMPRYTSIGRKAKYCRITYENKEFVFESDKNKNGYAYYKCRKMKCSRTIKVFGYENAKDGDEANIDHHYVPQNRKFKYHCC